MPKKTPPGHGDQSGPWRGAARDNRHLQRYIRRWDFYLTVKTESPPRKLLPARPILQHQASEPTTRRKAQTFREIVPFVLSTASGTIPFIQG
jgi:hypothetical protein